MGSACVHVRLHMCRATWLGVRQICLAASRILDWRANKHRNEHAQVPEVNTLAKKLFFFSIYSS